MEARAASLSVEYSVKIRKLLARSCQAGLLAIMLFTASSLMPSNAAATPNVDIIEQINDSEEPFPSFDAMCNYILSVIENPFCDFACVAYHMRWFTGLGCAL